jgi:alpha-glucosidase
MAGMDGVEPRHVSVGLALGRRRRPAKIRAALLMLLCLRGTPLLYQGDEIGLGDIPVAHEDMRDPLGVLYWPAYDGRDAARTPMPWRRGPGGGFTDPGIRPWLPLGDIGDSNVEDQRSDPGSTLHLVRDLIARRRATPDLLTGAYRSAAAPEGVWAWHRGDRTLVVVNLTNQGATLDAVEGRILIGTDREHDGLAVSGPLTLAAWEGVVVETS